MLTSLPEAFLVVKYNPKLIQFEYRLSCIKLERCINLLYFPQRLHYCRGQALVSDDANVDKKVTDQDFTGVAFSLLDVLKAVDTNWDKYVQAGQAATVKTFYSTWAQYGMNAWADQLTNIDA